MLVIAVWESNFPTAAKYALNKLNMCKIIYAFGEPVPQEIIELILKEDGEKCLTTEFIETTYWHEFLDNYPD